MKSGRAPRGLSIAVVTSVVLVFALAYVDLRREQARALDDVTGEQAALARPLAATQSARVWAVLRDLDTIAALDTVSVPALEQLVTQSGFYQELDLLDSGGRVVKAVPGAHPAVADDPRLRDALTALYASAPRDGRSVVSAPLPRASDRRQRLRFFLRRDQRGAVALLADTDRFFDGIRQAAFESSLAPMRWIVMDDALRWVVLGVDDGAGDWREGHPTNEVAQLLAAMGQGEHGTLFLPRAAAETLGLERRAAVAGFAVVPLRTGSWSVAVVASAKRVRDRARLAAWRLAAATGLTALIVGLFGVAITRQQRQAQALTDALRLAEATASLQRSLVRAEKLATIGTLAAGIAHEVGTPLGIISGRAEQLLTRVPDGEAGDAMRKGVTSILGQVDKVSTTIRQLLDFARTRSVAVEAVAAATAIDAATSLLEHRFRQAKVIVSTDAPPTLPPLAADPGQLEQVIVNLLMNACDACSVGGHVNARARAADEGVVLEVVDDGSGIAPEHLPAVLDPFFTTKKRGQGTGLGLTIAADIIKNHGGSLVIDSAPGKGTTVRVVWPYAKAEEKS